MQTQMRFRPPTPQSTFDAVARRYDFLNSLLSLGLDQRWRYQAVQQLQLPPQAQVLDVATGTGSLALAVAAKAPKDTTVTACDLNKQMLAVAQERIQKSGTRVPIRLVHSPGETLPFNNDVFDAVTIAFAIDDMADRNACAREMFRVLKPGGQIVLLELSLPEHPVLLSVYKVYLQLFPLIGRFLGRGGYGHLREEILTYRGRAAIQELLNNTEFTAYQFKSLTGGLVTVHSARKPE